MKPPSPRSYRVRDLVRRVRTKLESWGDVWVEGELSDVTNARSGHVYFVLEDGPPPSQLRAIMFRSDVERTNAELIKGERVRALGSFTVYEARGGLQLMVRRVERVGDGDRKAQLARLKKKLAAAGLFAPERKRPLPRFPRVVGVVTSARGAALHDVIRVARERAPVRIVVRSCVVQGADAAADIARAIRELGAFPGLDVLIVTRGGGGREDLSAFDEEPVARAIAACPAPVVSGVGHEVDVTIADLVADVRAATPSNAAEIAVPDADALRRDLEARRRRLQHAFHRYEGGLRLRLERMAKRLGEPRRDVGAGRRALLELSARLARAGRATVARRKSHADALRQRLARQEPRRALDRDRARIVELERRMERATGEAIGARRRRLTELQHTLSPPPLRLLREQLDAAGVRLRAAGRGQVRSQRAPLAQRAAQLHALSPLAVLGRGYAIVLAEGRALTDVRDVSAGDSLEVRLARGALEVRVEHALDGLSGSEPSPAEQGPAGDPEP